MEGKPYNEKVDIYSLGIILLELCFVFKTFSERRIILEKVRAESQIPEILKQNYPIEYSLIQRMIARDPLKRSSASELIQSYEFNYLKEEFQIFENED
jgi:serine/threonine protein kinase